MSYAEPLGRSQALRPTHSPDSDAAGSVSNSEESKSSKSTSALDSSDFIRKSPRERKKKNIEDKKGNGSKAQNVKKKNQINTVNTSPEIENSNDEDNSIAELSDDTEEKKILKSRKPSRSPSMSTRSNSRSKLNESTNQTSEDTFIDYSSEEEEQSTIPTIQLILTHRVDEEGNKEYLIKMHGSSYRSSTWTPHSVIESTQQGRILLQKYHKLHPNDPPAPPYYVPAYDIPERIIGSRVNESGDREFLVKWTLLDYDQCSWETVESLENDDLIANYDELNRVPSLKERFTPPHPNPSDFKAITTPPKSKHGLKARTYQVEGLNFLLNSWYNNRNAILADEMGLGKTLQSLLFLENLATKHSNKGPFIVIGPLSTIAHWEREVREWTSLRPLEFNGNKLKRDMIKQYEIFYPDTNVPKFNVLITTYEYIIREAAFLSQLNWRCVVVDEAHRLKNVKSRLMESLSTFKADFKILLTGTPLQNNINELYSLLHFLEFNLSSEEFQEKFGTLSEPDQIVELQELLKPIMLRRMKSDVEKSLAPLEEVIIECDMTRHQRIYYQSIFSKNKEYLTRGAHKSNATNLMNISMELRKVCNHTYLINGSEEQILVERKALCGLSPNDDVSQDFILESLIRSSGKTVLLDKLLAKLKKDGHRVLIFSQMTRMLDILQDFLFFRGYKHERVDGSVRGEDRQAAIDRFNAPESDIFVFLLCTKAAGVGINLASADTVVIYDSDWNPQNDIQATARCHRIGQTKQVRAYRFVTANTYEQTLFEKASMKLGLDHAVLETNRADELEKLLKLGAYHAFESTDKFGEEDIDTILSRSRTITHDSLENNFFSKAQFEVDNDEIDFADPDFWSKYLQPDADEEEQFDGTMAERRRKQRPSEEQPTKVSSDKWSKRKLQTLLQLLLKYGYGRWGLIGEEGGFKIDIKVACKAIMRKLLQACDGSPLFDSVMRGGDEAAEKKFAKKYKELIQPLLTNAQWKIQRMEMLYYLTTLVQSCNNPPMDIFIPESCPSKPAEWWSSMDDKLLLMAAYDGKLQSSKWRNVELTGKALGARLRALISEMKQAHIKLGPDLPFSNETLKMSSELISKRAHRLILSTLSSYGFTNEFEIRELCDLPPSSENYIKQLISLIDGNDVTITLAEPMLPAQISRIKARISLFERARDMLDTQADTLSKNDLTLLTIFAEKGIFSTEPYYELLGQDVLEGKIIKAIKDATKQTTQKVPKKRIKSGSLTIDFSALLSRAISDVSYMADSVNQRRMLHGVTLPTDDLATVVAAAVPRSIR